MFVGERVEILVKDTLKWGKSLLCAYQKKKHTKMTVFLIVISCAAAKIAVLKLSLSDAIRFKQGACHDRAALQKSWIASTAYIIREVERSF